MDKLDEVEWRSPEWINVHGLRTDNVLEYLSESPFWDRQSSNQQLRMQRGGTAPVPTVDDELARLRGAEYVLLLAREPDLWVVRKQWRSGDGDDDTTSTTTPLADYYIIGARVYMAPVVGDVLTASALAAAESLRAVVGGDIGVSGDEDNDEENDEDDGDTDTDGEDNGETTLPERLVRASIGASIDPNGNSKGN